MTRKHDLSAAERRLQRILKQLSDNAAPGKKDTAASYAHQVAVLVRPPAPNGDAPGTKRADGGGRGARRAGAAAAAELGAAEGDGMGDTDGTMPRVSKPRAAAPAAGSLSVSALAARSHLLLDVKPAAEQPQLARSRRRVGGAMGPAGAPGPSAAAPANVRVHVPAAERQWALRAAPPVEPAPPLPTAAADEPRAASTRGARGPSTRSAGRGVAGASADGAARAAEPSGCAAGAPSRAVSEHASVHGAGTPPRVAARCALPGHAFYDFARVAQASADLGECCLLEPPSRLHWFACIVEMAALADEAATRRQRKLRLRAQLPSLPVAYMADRLDLDDPIFGYQLRHKVHGHLLGYIVLTTFTTWAREFSWNSSHPASSLAPLRAANAAVRRLRAQGRTAEPGRFVSGDEPIALRAVAQRTGVRLSELLRLNRSEHPRLTAATILTPRTSIRTSANTGGGPAASANGRSPAAAAAAAAAAEAHSADVRALQRAMTAAELCDELDLALVDLAALNAPRPSGSVAGGAPAAAAAAASGCAPLPAPLRPGTRLARGTRVRVRERTAEPDVPRPAGQLAERAVDSAAGELAAALNAQERSGDPRDTGVVWPRVAEVSLLAALGCGRWLVQLAIDEMRANGKYDYVVLQAALGAVPFYEGLGFRRVGAVARYGAAESSGSGGARGGGGGGGGEARRLQPYYHWAASDQAHLDQFGDVSYMMALSLRERPELPTPQPPANPDPHPDPATTAPSGGADGGGASAHGNRPPQPSASAPSAGAAEAESARGRRRACACADADGGALARRATTRGAAGGSGEASARADASAVPTAHMRRARELLIAPSMWPPAEPMDGAADLRDTLIMPNGALAVCRGDALFCLGDGPGGRLEARFEVHEVVERRGAGRTLQYRVRWADELGEPSTWEPAHALDAAPVAIADFERRMCSAPATGAAAASTGAAASSCGGALAGPGGASPHAVARHGRVARTAAGAAAGGARASASKRQLAEPPQPAGKRHAGSRATGAAAAAARPAAKRAAGARRASKGARASAGGRTASA